MDEDAWKYSNPETKEFRWVGVLREQWFSICSAHSQLQHDCACCQTGRWINLVQHRAESWLYTHDYQAWFAHANQPGSEARKALEHAFPNLKS